MKNKEIKKLYLEGYTITSIAQTLGISFVSAKQSIISQKLEMQERSTKHGRILKNIDRHTGKVKVQLDSRTWVYLDPKDDLQKRIDFKRKQLKL